MSRKALASACAQMAMEAAGRQPPILYGEEDCQAFIEETARRAGGDIRDYRGSNDMFRNACSYVAPLKQAKREGRLVPGAVLFIVKQDGGEPDRYKADGLGNASHIGWYTGGEHEVVHSSAIRGQVAPSTIKNAWTHVGWLKEVDYTEYTGGWTADGELKPVDYNKEVHIVLYEAKVTGGALNVRERPSLNGRWLHQLKEGTIVRVLEETNSDWVKLESSQGQGYSMRKFLTVDHGLTGAQPGSPAVVIPCGSLSEAEAIATILRNAQARQL